MANSNLRGPQNDRQIPQTQPDVERYPPQLPPPNERPWQQRYSATHPQNVDQYIDDDDETENNALYELSELCASAGRLEMNVGYGDEDHEEHNSSWNPVRFWIQVHTKEEWQASLEVHDQDGKTALHIACQHQPPLDVMDHLVHADSSTSKLLEIQDVFGWTPLHYLCSLSAPPDVVQLIAEMCSEAKLLVTNKGLTPLHLALIGPFRDYPDVIATLASKGASRKVDEQGLLVRLLHAGRSLFCRIWIFLNSQGVE
jgi:ankyrin repeat protein